MVEADVYIKAVAAIVTATFCAILLVGARGRKAGSLAVFFALITINQASEALRPIVAPGDAVALFRIASIAAAFDPLALAVFVAQMLGDRPRRTRALWWILAGACVLALWAGWGLPELPGQVAASEVFPTAISLFTFVVYGYVLLDALRELRRRPEAMDILLLVPALSVVALPLVDRALGTSIYFLPLVFQRTVGGFSIFIGTIVFVSLAACAVILRAAVDLPPRARRAVAGGALAAIVLILASEAFSFSVILGGVGITATRPALVILGRLGGPARWIVFSLLASMALLRGDELGMGLASRRRATRVLIGLGIIVLAGALVAVVGTIAPGAISAIGPVEAIVLLASLAASQAGSRTIDKLALRIYDVPLPGDRESANALYERAVGTLLVSGGIPSRDPDVQRLRRDLGIDVATASLIERMAEGSAGGPLAVGQLVGGRYRLDSSLGSGGGGRVYLAEDLTLQRRVVIKELHDSAADGAALREARAAGGLQHANVITIYDVIRRGPAHLIVSEYAAGGRLDPDAPMPNAVRRQIALGILSGAAAVHAHGIVHGDIKPGNILLTPDLTPKIADFGLARARAERTAGVGEGEAVVGTPAFLAPEQRHGARASARTDVFALGVVLRQLVGADAPASAADVLARATAEDPSLRYANAGEMLAAWRAAWAAAPAG